MVLRDPIAPRILQGDSPDSMPLQRRHEQHRSRSVLLKECADKPCVDLRIDGVLEKLNELMGTKYKLEMKGLAELLGNCVDARLDLGKAYGMCRPHWKKTSDFTQLAKSFKEDRRRDSEERKKAIKDGMVIQPNLPPRRIWDLYSNRVLYWHTAQPEWKRICAVSHSWVAEPEKAYTSINEYRWRVPIPKDVTLERVRYDLLDHGAEYAWIDVLCLRQEDSQRPDQKANRELEWLTDVPTIGFVYQAASKTLIYLNGLGRPVRLTNFDDELHWLNRAWTLQEISGSLQFGGLTKDLITETDLSHRLEGSTLPASVLWERVATCMKLAQGASSVFDVLNQMKQRYAKNDTDRISGLARLLNPKLTKLPVYDAKEDLEGLWIRLVESMASSYRAELFLLYPSPGRRKYLWMPAWQDIKASASKIGPDMVSAVKATALDHVIVDVGKDKAFRFHGWVMEHCKLEGLGEVENADAHKARIQLGLRTGILSFKESKLSVVAHAHHQEKIPQTGHHDYTLVGTSDFHYWVVGRMTKEGRLEKVSVIRIESSEHKKTIEKHKLARTASFTLV